MPLNEDVNDYLIWATNLGCPFESIPVELDIKSLFKSRQRDIFYNLMKLVLPRQEISHIKNNIFLKKMKNISVEVLPFSLRSTLPKELQISLKMNELKAKRTEMQSEIEKQKREYAKLLITIKGKNIQHIKLKERCELFQVKVNLFSLKSYALDDDIVKEQKNSNRIVESMPVKMPAAGEISKDIVTRAIDEAKKVLNDFYAISTNNGNPATLDDAKHMLWKRLRAIFAQISNARLFNAIASEKKEQLTEIMTLYNVVNHGDDREMHTNTTQNREVDISALEKKMLQCKALTIRLALDAQAMHRRGLQLVDTYRRACVAFEEKMLKKFEHVSNMKADKKKEYILEFMKEYKCNAFRKAENAFYAQCNEKLKRQLNVETNKLEEHKRLILKIKEMYDDAELYINRITRDMKQLEQARDKIEYSREMMQKQLKNIRRSKTRILATGSKLKTDSKALSKTMSNNSFDLGANFLSSTLMSTQPSECGNVSHVSGQIFGESMRAGFGVGAGVGVGMGMGAEVGINKNFEQPQHAMEMKIFADIPLENLKPRSNTCSFYFLPNPLIVGLQERTSTLQQVPGTLLTAHGALEEVRSRVEIHRAINEFAADLKIDEKITQRHGGVDVKALKAAEVEQHDRVVQLLDISKTCNENTHHQLKEAKHLYDVILNNEIRHQVPKTRLFQNLRYRDYERDYEMYYSLIKSSKSSQ